MKRNFLFPVAAFSILFGVNARANWAPDSSDLREALGGCITSETHTGGHYTSCPPARGRLFFRTPKFLPSHQFFSFVNGEVTTIDETNHDFYDFVRRRHYFDRTECDLRLEGDESRGSIDSNIGRGYLSVTEIQEYTEGTDIEIRLESNPGQPDSRSYTLFCQQSLGWRHQEEPQYRPRFNSWTVGKLRKTLGWSFLLVEEPSASSAQ